MLNLTIADACGKCGYAEFYITQDTLELVNSRWKRTGNK
jgi:predicted nucleic-acid-binding Zn-ribbon protein